MTVFEGSPPSSQQNYCFDSRQGLVYVDGMTPSQGAKEMFAKNVLLSLVVLFVLTGCKILIEVPPGGKVITESGSYECNSGEICEIDIVYIH